MCDTILVPIDTSGETRDGQLIAVALDHAVATAERSGAEVHLLAVVDPSRNPMKFGIKEVDDLNRVASALVRELVATYEDHDVKLRGEIRRGRPYEEILEYADEIGAESIVIGRDRTEEVPVTVLGRTAIRLARLAPIPVTVVPGPADKATEQAHKT